LRIVFAVAVAFGLKVVEFPALGESQPCGFFEFAAEMAFISGSDLG